MTPFLAEVPPHPNDYSQTMAMNAIAEAGQEIARAINRVADETAAARKDFEPITEFFGGATQRLERVCNFLQAHRVKIVLGIVAILSAANWLPPAAADVIKHMASG